MSQVNENNNEKKYNLNQIHYIVEKERKQNDDIINENTISNYTDKLKQKYKNNKLISSYEEDYTRNNITVMKLLLQRN